MLDENVLDLLDAVNSGDDAADTPPDESDAIPFVPAMHIRAVRALIAQGRRVAAFAYAHARRGNRASALDGYPDDVRAVLEGVTPASYQRPPDVLLVPFRRAMAVGDLDVARHVLDRLVQRFYVLPEYERIEEAEAMRHGTTGGNTHPDLDEPSRDELAALEAALEVDVE